jgi:myo-inositol-1(or 4)-monophosphatase
MTYEPDLDDPKDRRQLMLRVAEHAATSSANHLRGWFSSKYLTGRLPVPEDWDEGLVSGVRNHAEAWLRGLYEAPLYLSRDPRPWTDDEPAWVINVQDGWQNLRTGIEHAAISYTLIAHRGPVISVVAPVFSDRWYMAAAGLGAWQQDGQEEEPRRIYASSAETLASSSLTFGLPDGDTSAAAFRPATRMRPKAGALRLSGCSSLDLVDVARGATQGHFEGSVNYADLAAALLILNEAGGVITDWKGEYLNPQRVTDPMNLAASNDRVHGEMLKTLSKIKTAPGAVTV